MSGAGRVRSAGARAREWVLEGRRRGWGRPARVVLVRAAGAAALFAAGVAAGRAGGAAVADEARAPAGAARASGGGEEDGFLARYAALRAVEARTADRAEALLDAVPIHVPVRGRLTSGYTPRRFHPVLRRVRPHWGLDIAAPAGTAVVSSADGTVLDVARSATYGLVVDVAHRGGEYITRYAHLSAVLVREGQRVRRGDVVGRVGATGLVTGPHLHFEVFVHGRRRDPALLFDPGEAAALLP